MDELETPAYLRHEAETRPSLLLYHDGDQHDLSITQGYDPATGGRKLHLLFKRFWKVEYHRLGIAPNGATMIEESESDFKHPVLPRFGKELREHLRAHYSAFLPGLEQLLLAYMPSKSRYKN